MKNLILWVSLLFSLEAAGQWVQFCGSELSRIGDTLVLTLQFDITDGFHIQAAGMGEENVMETELHLELPNSVRLEELEFPEPHRILLQGSTDSLQVYSGKAIFKAILISSQQEGVKLIPGQLFYQACDEKKCFYPRTLEFGVKVDLR
ncbi:protein-disulfide reductase DsbD domain-containing protein [Robertkochia aurantiaca]|uniref:protein-disulfide reductase DsbD domain-containing protein n=1 Tax=Robertkochia aurantiaca TaxID=2873700 RepID=UPI001CCBDCAC|nr:protein-disulfide reductase DsbD domain-containing protein [Robertkochia sp. 3YJGBD-33]